MPMVLNILVLLCLAILAWLLTGFEERPIAESPRTRFVSRMVRVLIFTGLAALFLRLLNAHSGLEGFALLLIVPVGMALVLRGSLASLLSRWLMPFVDPAFSDPEEHDSKKSRRYMDAIAHLVHSGHHEQAIQLCEKLKKSGEVDLITLENTLAYLGVKQVQVKAEKPLAKAARLRSEARFAEAEKILKALTKKHPPQPEAAMMLMRLYAEDMRQPEKATAVLNKLQKEPNISGSLIEFARRSIEEWSRATPKTAGDGMPAPPQTVDELLAHGYYGSAIKAIEHCIEDNPQDFELRMKLAEIHADLCGNTRLAEKIVHDAEADINLSAEEIAAANAKLNEWQKLHIKLQ